MTITKDTFIPTYDTDVSIQLPVPGQPAIPVNPRYCLSAQSAAELAAVLTAEGLGPVTVVQNFPETGFIRFNYSRTVPWFIYRDGATENAAFVAWNWLPNRNGALALYYAAMEVQGVMRDFETLGA